jgi:hypothetical protein
MSKQVPVADTMDWLVRMPEPEPLIASGSGLDFGLLILILALFALAIFVALRGRHPNGGIIHVVPSGVAVVSFALYLAGFKILAAALPPLLLCALIYWYSGRQ